LPVYERGAKEALEQLLLEAREEEEVSDIR
jgi:hypothetical protein